MITDKQIVWINQEIEGGRKYESMKTKRGMGDHLYRITFK
jgi:hypothetical protein